MGYEVTTMILARAFSWLPALSFLAVNVFADASSPSSPQIAGARYGQALGAIEICPGAALSQKAERLEASFNGQDLDLFLAQAAKIYNSWKPVIHCVNQNDPNPCRIIIQMSCQAAVAEIGPGGSAFPDLLGLH
jgi:hypothetical protein